MTHFFISYAKKDTRELALKLNDALNALEGITSWVDKSLRAGKSWELQIQSEIDRCDYMIVLYSPDINRHKHGEEESYVLTEIAYAKYTLKKPIIPVMAQKTAPPMSLTTSHYIDFTLADLTLDELVAAICDEAIQTPIASSVQTFPASSTVSPSSSQSKVFDLLPTPFDWCPISAGQVTLEGINKTYDVAPFDMAKYPITNAQFQVFVNEPSGYQDATWWTFSEAAMQ